MRFWSINFLLLFEHPQAKAIAAPSVTQSVKPPCMPTIYFKLATPVCQHAQYRMWSSQLTLPNAAAAAAESF